MKESELLKVLNNCKDDVTKTNMYYRLHELLSFTTLNLREFMIKHIDSLSNSSLLKHIGETCSRVVPLLKKKFEIISHAWTLLTFSAPRYPRRYSAQARRSF